MEFCGRSSHIIILGPAPTHSRRLSKTTTTMGYHSTSKCSQEGDRIPRFEEQYYKWTWLCLTATQHKCSCPYVRSNLFQVFDVATGERPWPWPAHVDLWSDLELADHVPRSTSFHDLVCLRALNSDVISAHVFVTWRRRLATSASAFHISVQVFHKIITLRTWPKCVSKIGY